MTLVGIEYPKRRVVLSVCYAAGDLALPGRPPDGGCPRQPTHGERKPRGVQIKDVKMISITLTP
jgi:hypothetical protein